MREHRSRQRRNGLLHWLLRGRRSRVSDCGNALAGFDKLPIQLRKWPAIHGLAGDNDHVNVAGKKLLVAAEDLAKPALGAVSQDGPAHGGPGGDKADAGQRLDGRRGGSGRVAPQVPDCECLAIGARPALAGGADVALAAEVLPRAETHAEKARSLSVQATVRRLRPLRRREASTLRPPLVDMRARNPILRTRFLRCGRKVGCIILKWSRVDGSAGLGRGCQGWG